MGGRTRIYIYIAREKQTEYLDILKTNNNNKKMSKSCCPDGSWPALIVDTERESLNGTVETLPTGLKIYYTPAKTESKKAVIVLYDVYGFKGGRIKSVCDQFACEGFHVLMPDLYGNEASIADYGGFSSPGGQKFLKEFTNEDSANKLDAVYEYLKAKGCSTFGAIGFCWGAYPVFGESARGKIQAGASCHPSLGAGEMLFGDKVSDQAGKVTCPILLCPAGNDPPVVKNGGDVQKIIQSKGLSCDIEEFPDMAHGWVPRGDTSDGKVKRDVQKSLETACKFFHDKLSSSGL